MEIAFWVLSIIIIFAAFGVVLLKDIFRAALFLILCFTAVAGVFILLSADFLAAIQILIYVGAISVLIILAIMLTREVQRGNLFNRLSKPSLVIAGIVCVIFITAMLGTDWVISTAPPLEPTTPFIAKNLFSEDGMFFAVQMSAVLLLAAIIGAIVLVRDK